MAKILIVDDSRFACRCLQDTISKYTTDYEFEILTDSEKAVEVFNEMQNDISFVVVDFNMPKLNGLELANQIRKITTSVPIIMLTASSAFETGARDIPEWLKVVPKPINEAKVQEIFSYLKDLR